MVRRGVGEEGSGGEETMNSYMIAIPTSRRPMRMVRVMELLPTALICIDEREASEYSKLVPDEKLWLHPPLERMGQIRQWMLDNCEAESLVTIDDDFRGVLTYVGVRIRKITDPNAILQIIENGVNILCDLDLPLYCWNRNRSLLQFRGCDPIGFFGPASVSWITRGRGLGYDTSLFERVDVDFTMQVLLKNRILICERRYYFDGGLMSAGAGGLQGVRTGKLMDESTRTLVRRWGKYVDVETGMKTKGGNRHMSVRVQRKSPLATLH